MTAHAKGFLGRHCCHFLNYDENENALYICYLKSTIKLHENGWTTTTTASTNTKNMFTRKAT